MQNNYYNSLLMVEKLHRLFLEVIKNDLNKNNIRDINNIQAILLYNIGAGNSNLSVGDLTSQGYYQGSNVSYNLRKLVENGYILQVPCLHDRRSSEVSLNKKGIEMYESLQRFFDNHDKNLPENNISSEMVSNLINSLKSIEGYLNKIAYK